MPVNTRLKKDFSILLVEDDNTTRLLISELLTAKYSRDYPGMRILKAADGREGLRMYLSEKPDVVLTDIMMPEMDGLAMAKEIRAADTNAKIIVITALNEMSSVINSIEVGVNHYIFKPVQTENIVSAINKTLGQIALEEQVESQNEKLRQLAFELMRAEETERRNVAVKLHDFLIQNLALALISLDQLKNRIPVGHAEETGLLEKIRGLLGNSIELSRDLTFELSPPILFELGLQPALEWLIDDLKKKAPVQLKLHYRLPAVQLADDLLIFIFRVVRELAMNALKHAKPEIIRIHLRQKGDLLELCVEDDGTGFDPELINRKKGFGLFSIREKLHFLDGELKIVPAPGKGTRVVVTMPMISGGRSEA